MSRPLYKHVTESMYNIHNMFAERKPKHTSYREDALEFYLNHIVVPEWKLVGFSTLPTQGDIIFHFIFEVHFG